VRWARCCSAPRQFLAQLVDFGLKLLKGSSKCAKAVVVVELFWFRLTVGEKADVFFKTLFCKRCIQHD